MENFETIRKEGRLLYEGLRGSHIFGLATEQSDEDTVGIFIASKDTLYGIQGRYEQPTHYQTQCTSDKNDDVWYEVGAFVELLTKSNPTMLEALYTPEEYIRYMHPVFKLLRDNRDMFLSKDALNAFSKYAISQIKKARGLNKKIVNEVNEKKEVIDFCYTYNDKQGSEPLSNWLAKWGLKQKYCGLNHIPNMERMYGLFYDWQEHLHLDWKNSDEFLAAYRRNEQPEFFSWLSAQGILSKGSYDEVVKDVFEKAVPKGYHGVQREDGTSCEIRLDSIIPGDRPLALVAYNDNGFQTHCRQYKEYQDWVKKRNQVRYESNLGHNYDSKNISHCVRLLTMSLELADNKGFIIDRRIAGDRDYLLDIKKHKFEYEEVIAKCDELEAKLEEAKKTCTLPEHVDVEKANGMLIELRKEFYCDYPACACD